MESNSKSKKAKGGKRPSASHARSRQGGKRSKHKRHKPLHRQPSLTAERLISRANQKLTNFNKPPKKDHDNGIPPIPGFYPPSPPQLSSSSKLDIDYRQGSRRSKRNKKSRIIQDFDQEHAELISIGGRGGSRMTRYIDYDKLKKSSNDGGGIREITLDDFNDKSIERFNNGPTTVKLDLHRGEGESIDKFKRRLLNQTRDALVEMDSVPIAQTNTKRKQKDFWNHKKTKKIAKSKTPAKDYTLTGRSQFSFGDVVKAPPKNLPNMKKKTRIPNGAQEH